MGIYFIKILMGGICMKKILIPIDGSDNSMKAVLQARDLGSCTKADITIMFVVNDFKSHPYAIDRNHLERLRADIVDQSNKIVEEAKKSFDDYPHTVDTKVRSGIVEVEILEEAQSGGYDLIIMGSRGLGRFAKTMLGSISQKVLNNSKISVLIVK